MTQNEMFDQTVTIHEVQAYLNKSDAGTADVSTHGPEIRVAFESKPTSAVRSWLKRHGFRWARKYWTTSTKDGGPAVKQFALPQAPLSTSCYRSLSAIPQPLRPVGISVGRPRWYKGPGYEPLFPTRAMLKMPIEEYDRRYHEILANLDPQQVFEDLGENAVMLCWEKPNVRCHRRLVAEWLENALGITIPELGLDRTESLPYVEMPMKT